MTGTEDVTPEKPQSLPPEDVSDGGTANNFQPNKLERSTTKQWGVLKLRTDHDTSNQDWWFASIAIPLLAATIAPLANVLSIAALVSYWRADLQGPDGNLLPPLSGREIKDPSWVYGLNLASLICGYVGNAFLLMNFTNRIRYIIALPVSIILWYISTAILIAIQACMNSYVPPNEHETYTQAFWYGVIAAVLYLICSMILMVNMVGYFLGHYPQQFNLTDSQRTLILQTFLFFIWLAGGAGMYSKIESTYGDQQWSFSDALYFCDVTILTVGFGDLVPTESLGRGLLLPYSVGGIIMLGLMISSITTFAAEISHANIVRKRVNRERLRTLARSTTRSSFSRPEFGPGNWKISSPQSLKKSKTETHDAPQTIASSPGKAGNSVIKTIKRTGTMVFRGNTANGWKQRKPSLHLLREEKDRFDAMRQIQHNNAKFKQWSSLVASVFVLCLLWFLGAVVFWQVEGNAQNMTYFDAIYFCFVSLITIGYGDFSPVTNAGRPFFVVWSLLAVPSITILISNMADTVIAGFKKRTELLASFTLLPQYGIWRTFLDKHPWLLLKIEGYESRKSAEKRVAEGFEAGPNPADDQNGASGGFYKIKTIDEIAKEREKPVDSHSLANKLSTAIRRTAEDFKVNPKRRYEYEEWVEFTELIRFSKAPKHEEDEADDDDEGLIEWDWIGENSPMMTEQTEPEWLLDRLCESMSRYVKSQRPRSKRFKRGLAQQGDWGALNDNAVKEGMEDAADEGNYDGEDTIEMCRDEDGIERRSPTNSGSSYD